jgi:quinol monooxygenase YgiN
MSGTVHVPWYATLFRGDQLQAELERVNALSVRYGATHYALYRSEEDSYRFLQVTEWDEHDDWDRYWNGPELIDFRAYCQGWFQVPVLYSWYELVAEGEAVSRAASRSAPGNGH